MPEGGGDPRARRAAVIVTSLSMPRVTVLQPPAINAIAEIASTVFVMISPQAKTSIAQQR